MLKLFIQSGFLLGFLVSFLQLPISKKSLHLSLSWPVLPFKHPGAIWVSCHSHTCGHFSGIYLDASSLSQIKFRCPILLNLTSEMYSFTSWLMQCPTKLQITAITTCFMLVLLFITRFLGCTVNILFVNNEVFLHPVSFKSVINCIKFSTDLQSLPTSRILPSSLHFLTTMLQPGSEQVKRPFDFSPFVVALWS